MAKTSALYTATQWFAVTKSDTTIIPDGVRALYIGGAGDVALEGQDGVQVTFAGLAVGAILPVQPAKVLNTGTSASNIIAMY